MSKHERRFEKADGHFFASDSRNWVTGKTIAKAVAGMNRVAKASRDNHLSYSCERFALWFVPLPQDAEYGIDEYAPDVEGAYFIGSFDHF